MSWNIRIFSKNSICFKRTNCNFSPVFAVKKTATTYGTQYVKITEFNNSFNGYVVVIENEEMPKLTIKYNIIKKDKRYSLIEENHE